MVFYKEGHGLDSMLGDGMQFRRHCPPPGQFCCLKFDTNSGRAAFESPDRSFRKWLLSVLTRSV